MDTGARLRSCSKSSKVIQVIRSRDRHSTYVQLCGIESGVRRCFSCLHARRVDPWTCDHQPFTCQLSLSRQCASTYSMCFGCFTYTLLPHDMLLRLHDWTHLTIVGISNVVKTNACNWIFMLGGFVFSLFPHLTCFPASATR